MDVFAVGGALQLQQDDVSESAAASAAASALSNESTDGDSNTLTVEPSPAASTVYPKVCRNEKQFEAWQKSRPWLIMNINTKSVQCSTCASVKRLGLHKVRGQRDESAFVDGNVCDCKDAKTLLKKIDKHKDSVMHKKCEELLKIRENEQIRKGANIAQEKFVEKNKRNVTATAVVFRTAYECAQSHLSFREHERLMELQSANGLVCGEMLYSHHACANIIKHIACCMRKEIVELCCQYRGKVFIDDR